MDVIFVGAVGFRIGGLYGAAVGIVGYMVVMFVLAVLIQ